MDSLATALKNSSSSLYVPPRLELFLPVLLLQHHILSPETLRLSYSSILVAFFSKLCVSHRGICTPEHTKQKMCPTRIAKNMFMLDFGPKHTKTWELVNTWAS